MTIREFGAHGLAVLVVAISSASVRVAAQRTWIVDAANGPGAHFTDLAVAVSFAAEGDILVLRAGDYVGLAIRKPLTILGTRGATRILAPTATSPHLVVFGIQAAQRFVIRDVILGPGRYPRFVVGMTFRDCAGPVLAEGIEAGPDFSTLQFDRCARVAVTRCGRASSGGLGLHAIDSSVTATSCALIGRRANDAVHAWPGLLVERQTRMVVGDVFAAGGEGWVMVLPTRTQLHPGAPGVDLRDSSLEIARGVIVAGGATPLAGVDSPAILGRGQASIDWTTVLLPTGGAPAVAPTVQVRRIDRPTLRSGGMDAAGRWELTLESTPARAFWIGVGLPSPPVATGLGELWFELGGSMTIGVGMQAQSGATTVRLPVPPGGSRRGLTLVAHALAGDVLGDFALTPPSVLILP
jgi:hypothetical protein